MATTEAVAAAGGGGGGAGGPSGGSGGEASDIGLGSGIGIEMLKALYDFQAVYPKTISFDEGEYFILYQTSARQRNWWQVVSMKGNIGFVPSNYVMKIKVEHDFLISFLNSSIESLEKCTDHEINGIMSKDELLDRLREKKHTMERLYAESSERDGDSSLSYSYSYSDKGSHRHSHPHPTQSQTHLHSQHRQHSPPPSGSGGGSQRLDMSKKSMSSPAVGSSCGLPQGQGMIESPSMGSMQFQGSSCTIQTPQQQQPLPAPPAPAPSPSPAPASSTPTASTSASASASSSSKAAASAGGDVAQDNSITSEPSETTTTTTTTSEDVVTTYKETSQMSISQQHKPANGSTASASISASASASNLRSSAGNGNGNGSTAGLHQELQQEEADSAPDKSDDASAVPSDDGCQANGDSADNSQALDSIDSPSHRQRGLSLGRIEEGATGGGQLKVESSDVYQIVDALRRNTNLSFDLSCEALRVVLTSLEQLYNGAINPYLEAVAVHVTGKVATPKELLGITHDAKRLQYLFAQLADCKNDTEQRTWMLYEDEEDIIQFLEELVEILINADESISCYEMSCDQYQMFINLVQYYQMETRWSIKRLLLKTFTAACHLDYIIVDILLTSVLPLEIVEDMKTHFSNLERFKQLVKMLTIIFSLGQPMPVNHQDYLGVHFASFLLEIVEGNNPELLVDMVIALILAFNQQFSEHTFNVIIEGMQNLPSAKVFTEKLLLLLNREDDPTRLLKHPNEQMNTVLRMFIDIFSHPDTAGMFYTNDIKVLIDIVVRQLSDLDAGSSTRPCYLELCRRILRNTNYQEHQHRKHDLMKIFTRIFCEETECSASDQQLVREIANEFPQLFKA
ncbi:NCK-interacting protein with SH3 domain isoform X1 [Drosophila gunungcola]|uniref:SH3 domain-containing protein n=2 Tax=Drosophila gunungcola TaxID=103775 RepID=A0A9P9YDY3_9MUSC|nr:NCK-interacting protein with SH3 domain isoform X1 [Drosophila gunungcola]XP_052850064.1 NCK-interacting protein with SH3 domain isoform X1 [Drosophila gunungcola]XP_052850065.1 NCK-interacting protein with SH3 domain isoform X1 [Drosophila gunungcola]XP_052850066.1 NCK-interacting protein with SH3 domain isoform X1 [Drosophila gunungcola]XP_052850067.1 NCK-interacting protein with SH3 domain isoform X1 [Drosophila gunungcola]XP_052850068.1 NCK-interacting protein with SH3 domain isoform X1